MKKPVLFLFVFFAGICVKASPCSIHYPDLNSQIVSNRTSEIYKSVTSTIISAFAASNMNISESDIEFVVQSDPTSDLNDTYATNPIVVLNATVTVSGKQYIFNVVPQVQDYYNVPNTLTLLANFSERAIYNSVGDITGYACAADGYLQTTNREFVTGFTIIREETSRQIGFFRARSQNRAEKIISK